MGIARRRALQRVDALSVLIREHLAKMIMEPGASSARHWRIEVRTWIAQVERLSGAVGSRTGQEIKKSIAVWKQQLGAIYGDDQ
jgi:hypothetical protein